MSLSCRYSNWQDFKWPSDSTYRSWSICSRIVLQFRSPYSQWMWWESWQASVWYPDQNLASYEPASDRSDHHWVRLEWLQFHYLHSCRPHFFYFYAQKRPYIVDFLSSVVARREFGTPRCIIWGHFCLSNRSRHFFPEKCWRCRQRG